MDYRTFNVRTHVTACYCTRGCTGTVRESALKVWQLIQVKVHDFNTLLVPENVQLLGILRLSGMHKRWGVSSLRINKRPASLRHGQDQVVNHFRWEGYPLLSECLKQLGQCCRGVHSALTTSLQLVPSLQGMPEEKFGRCCWRGTVRCGVLHGVWNCRVEVQCHTTFNARNKAA